MTNKPKSRRSKKAVQSRNGASAADSSPGHDIHTSTSAKASITAEGRKPLTNSISKTPTIDDMQTIDHDPVKQSVADTGAQPMPSESGPHVTPASSLGPGIATNLPTEHVTNLEPAEVKTALTNKQLKKKARKPKQAQKAKVAPGAISSEELGVSGTLTEATSHSRQSSMPALSATGASTISECSTSEDKVSLATGNERPSNPRARNSSPDHGGQLLTQQTEFGQRIEPVYMEFDALIAELRHQGIAAEAKHSERADAREVPADAMPKGYNDAASPVLQRKFSFIEGKPDIADIRPILMDSSELLEHGRPKGKIRCVSSSENTLVDGDTLQDTGNSRNLGAAFTEPFWSAEMPERPKQPTLPLLGEGGSPPNFNGDARGSGCREIFRLSHNIAGNASRMRKQGRSSRPSGNGKELVADSDYRDWVEKEAVDDEEDYSDDDYGEESVDEGISDQLAAVLELKGKRLEALVQKEREEMGVLQDRYLSQRGYFKRRGAGRR